MCFFIIIATCLYFFYHFLFFFLRILVWSIMGQRKMNVWILILCTIVLACLHFFTMPHQPWIQDLLSRLNPYGWWRSEFEVCNAVRLVSGAWNALRCGCSWAVFLFLVCVMIHSIQLDCFLLRIQRRVWMYALCCLPGLSGIYLLVLSFYSVWTDSNCRRCSWICGEKPTSACAATSTW